MSSTKLNVLLECFDVAKFNFAKLISSECGQRSSPPVHVICGAISGASFICFVVITAFALACAGRNGHSVALF